MQLALERDKLGVLSCRGASLRSLGPICLVEVVMKFRGGTIKPAKVVMNELNGLTPKVKGKS